ncbi:MAG: ricin-type beta-trefoil lectin domain protein [Acidobacteriaceae bacterium]
MLITMFACSLFRRCFRSIVLSALLVLFCGLTASAFAAADTSALSATPPMGWNDWAHYQCNFTAQTILSNAKALVRTGLAAKGYDTVTIDDCWMQKDRDAQGNLQPDLQRFPHGIQPVAEAVHAMGLKFGIYEDAGYATCGGFAGSGVPKGGGNDHFLQDTRLFASWGVDYLKLDGCNLYVPSGEKKIDIYRKAYAAQHAALQAVDRPIVFSESAPAYFQGTPEWYDVLSWIGSYGQLWREGTDMVNYHPKTPDTPRFPSVLWNYSYNLPLGRFQKPGNWNDPDFIIGGDSGMTLPETRSQLALWSMMSAPLILSSDVDKLSPQAISILGNKEVLAVDQDVLGRMATLVRSNAAMDVLLKPLNGGDYAVAVLDHSPAAIYVRLRPQDLGFAAADCRLDARNLWNKAAQPASAALHFQVASHDTALWRLHPSSTCGVPTRTGAITMVVSRKDHNLDTYARCLSTTGRVQNCAGSPAESWTVADDGSLQAQGKCLDIVNGKLEMQVCVGSTEQRWNYNLVGNLISAEGGKCLSTLGPDTAAQSLRLETCGHNEPSQIWALPN